MSVPSYMIHPGQVALSEGTDLSRHSKVRLMLTTGEPNTPLTKRKIEEVWAYDSAPPDGRDCFECPESQGLYHVQEGFLIPEVVDRLSGRRMDPENWGSLSSRRFIVGACHCLDSGPGIWSNPEQRLGVSVENLSSHSKRRKTRW